MNLAAELSQLARGHTRSDWEGYEVNAGYAVMALPMSSGHVLGLRVFPRSDFGGYRSVWHRDPGGAWAQYVDGAPLEAGCPRVWGPALARSGVASISVEWVGPMALRVRMDDPLLDWSLEVGQSPGLVVLNALHRRLPLSTWRRPALVAARERILQALGLGRVPLTGLAPAGQRLVAALQRMYWVAASAATLDGEDLGGPVALPDCPILGGWALPRRGVLAVGEAHATIEDHQDYERLRRLTVGDTSDPRA